MKTLTSPFDLIVGNLELAKEDAPPGSKSVHWDVFPENYDDAVRSTEHWSYFLRNALSYNFNDSLNFSNVANALLPERKETLGLHSDVNPLIHIRTDHDYPPLLPEILNVTENQGQMNKIREIFTKVLEICGAKFLIENLAPSTGSPAVAELNFRYGDGPEQKIAVNYTDLYLIYYVWLIHNVTGKLFPTGLQNIVDIGAGFGGLSAKLKVLNPTAKVILFDLPEVNAVQTYYLKQRFPDANIKLYRDFKESGIKIFQDQSVDFIVLPGWAIETMPKHMVDLAVNTRSMMEMTVSTIENYFTHLHRVVRPGGLFTCINRYVKEPDNVCIKKYPYDDRWKILLSQTSNLQGHIHELILERTGAPQKFTVSESLRSLPPF